MVVILSHFFGAYFSTLAALFLLWIVSRAYWQYTIFFFWKKDGHIGEWLYWAGALLGAALAFAGSNPDFSFGARMGILIAIATHATYAIITEDYFDADYKWHNCKQAISTWRRDRLARAQLGSNLVTSAETGPAQSTPLGKLHLKVFISYRRSDARAVVERLYDHLVPIIADRIFKDVDTIPSGVDFRVFVRKSVEVSDVVLVMIGDQWLDPRLSNPDDPVRLEIEAALELRKPLIPVLLLSARMPTEQELPKSISELSYRNAIVIRNDPDFRRDLERLIEVLRSKPWLA